MKKQYRIIIQMSQKVLKNFAKMKLCSRSNFSNGIDAHAILLRTILVHLLLSIYISSKSDLDSIGFLGVYFSIFLVLWMGNKILGGVYDSYVGVLLGHNANLRKMGEWAVVTGATDGIGLAYAEQLAEKGINIVLISRSLDKLESCARRIRYNYSVHTKVIEVDFSISGELYEKEVGNALRGMNIGILINNVGMSYPGPEYFHVISSSPEFIYKMVNLNVISAAVMTRIVLPGMLDKGKGVIVNVGSYASLFGAPFFSFYSASKSFLETFTRDLAGEYEEKGIIFQYQSPGYVTTKLAKIKTASMFVPSPHDYVKAALNSIGLQRKSSIWIPQRCMFFGLSVMYTLFPVYYGRGIASATKTFWLFAKKRQMHKAIGYNNHMNV